MYTCTRTLKQLIKIDIDTTYNELNKTIKRTYASMNTEVPSKVLPYL